MSKHVSSTIAAVIALVANSSTAAFADAPARKTIFSMRDALKQREIFDNGNSPARPRVAQTDDLENEYPPGHKVPDEANPDLPRDETYFLLVPAPELTVGAVGSVSRNSGGANSSNGAGGATTDYAAGARGEMFLYSKLTQIRLRAVVLGGSDGFTADGALKFRFRPGQILGLDYGYGADIEGGNERAGGKLRAQGVAMVGKLKAFGDGTCVMHVFGQVKLGVYDNVGAQDQWISPVSSGALGTWARPAVGADAFAQCNRYRVQGDYQHVFSFNGAKGTDEFSLSFEKDWTVFNNISLGGFANGKAIRGTFEADEEWDMQALAGVQVKFGSTKKKRKVAE